MLNEFSAIKLIAHGERDIQVTDFNGQMAICADDEGCILISKKQAMEFFGLQERDALEPSKDLKA